MKPWKSETPDSMSGDLRCFNGATAMKPWKRPLRPAKTSSRSVLQWGHGDEAVEEQDARTCTTGQRGFNGATAMKPWKRTECVAVHPQTWWLQWGHGDEAVEETPAAVQASSPTRFNGATAMKPWKRCPPKPQRPTSCSFNGATAMKPWKSGHLDLERSCVKRLQWGHGDEAVEETLWNNVSTAANLLQWGHGDEAVEEPEM